MKGNPYTTVIISSGDFRCCKKFEEQLTPVEAAKFLNLLDTLLEYTPEEIEDWLWKMNTQTNLNGAKIAFVKPHDRFS